MFEQKRNKLITIELGMWIWASRYPIWYEPPLLKDVVGLGVPRWRRVACEPVISKFGLAPFGFKQSGPCFSWASKSTRLHDSNNAALLSTTKFWLLWAFEKEWKKRVPRVFSLRVYGEEDEWEILLKWGLWQWNQGISCWVLWSLVLLDLIWRLDLTRIMLRGF